MAGDLNVVKIEVRDVFCITLKNYNVWYLLFYSVKPSCMDDKHVGYMFIQVLSHGQLCHKIIQ